MPQYGYRLQSNPLLSPRCNHQHGHSLPHHLILPIADPESIGVQRYNHAQ